MKIFVIFKRIYSDYLMLPKYKEYKKLLENILSKNYHFITLRDFVNKNYDKTLKIAIMRHDVDTDINIAMKMFSIEKKLNIRCTYYFRLNTAEKKFIKEIEDFNAEASYHYEEISTFAFKNKIYSAEEIFKAENFEEIKNLFRANLNYFRTFFNVESATVASHGDFVNRYLGIANLQLLDSELRKECNILLESYDTEIMDKSIYVSDGKYLKNLIDSKISDFLIENKILYILIHPRGWSSAPIERFRIDIKRFFDGLRYFQKVMVWKR